MRFYPIAALVLGASSLFAQPTPETVKPQDAVGAILKLFDSYRIVMLRSSRPCYSGTSRR
jgi:hypothetical protein